MKRALLSLAALAFVPGFAFAQNGVSATPRIPFGPPVVDANTAIAGPVDLGCATGRPEAGQFPTQIYDAKTREHITYNLSRCAGGYVKGVEDETGKAWTIDVAADGVRTGRDLDGSKWRYDPHAKRYTNLSTGRSCEHTDFRHVCAG